MPDSLSFHGLALDGDAPPLIYLEGDASRRQAGVWTVFEGYTRGSPHSRQLWAE